MACDELIVCLQLPAPFHHHWGPAVEVNTDGLEPPTACQDHMQTDRDVNTDCSRRLYRRLYHHIYMVALPLLILRSKPNRGLPLFGGIQSEATPCGWMPTTTGLVGQR